MPKIQKTEAEWRAELTPEQYRILREKGTERPFTGEYDDFFQEGVYVCRRCETPLYVSDRKFHSGMIRGGLCGGDTRGEQLLQ